MTATATLTAQIATAAQNGDTARLEDLIEQMCEKARMAGMQDLLIDLVDAREITDEGVEFAIENNGCQDPRR